jgi:hypothetical protein
MVAELSTVRSVATTPRLSNADAYFQASIPDLAAVQRRAAPTWSIHREDLYNSSIPV